MSGSDLVFNEGKGRGQAFGLLPNTNDAINFRLLNTTSLETDSGLKDRTTFADITTGGSVKSDSTGYADQNITAITVNVDMTNDRCDVSVTSPGTVTWPTVGGATNHAISKLVTGYDNDTTGGTDANIVPVTMHSFDVTPDGTDIVATVNTFYRAS